MVHMKISQCVITLGGQGTRFQEIAGGIPKPLFPIEGVSSLERTISTLTDFYIDRFIFLCCHKHDLFEKQLPTLEKKYNCSISIYVEQYPMGEVGALFQLPYPLDKQFLFVNGDIIFRMDINRLTRFHNLNSGDITITTHTSTHPEDSDCILEDARGGIQEYKTKNKILKNSGCFLGNAGVALINRDLITLLKPLVSRYTKPDLFSTVVMNAQEQGYRVLSYNTTEYLKDIGTPSRYSSVSEDLRSGVIDKLCYINRQKALLIDRDNTINFCPTDKYITRKDQVVLIEENVKRIAEISKDYNFVLCITNQPQVAMGLCSIEEVNRINGVIAEKCLKIGLKISAYYICPHHIHSGYSGEIPELKIRCFCRKPLPGLAFRAAHERNIDLNKSLFIGDTWRDEEMASDTGMQFLNVSDLV